MRKERHQQKETMNNKPLRIIPLGGLGEVGKNMMAYEYDKDIILVDAGLMFPENDMLGIDYIIPDFKYLLDKTDRIKGIFITHGHEDHIGAIHHVMEVINAPIYATPLTSGLLENKLARNGLSQKAVVHTVNAGDKVKAGVFHRGILPCVPFHSGWCGIWYRMPGRIGRPFRRLQVRPHTGG